MTAREFQEWQEYYKQEPFGDDWLQASTIAAVTEGVWRNGRTRMDKFVPSTKPRPRSSSRQLETQMMHIAALHNARIEREQQPQNPAPPRRRVPRRSQNS
jgi:hypothetical protein